MAQAFQVSVIIPVYNAINFIDACIESVLKCSQVAEIILVNDASDDGSDERCDEWSKKNPLIQRVNHPDGKNHGTAASFNMGIQCATKPYIAFLGADDIYLPHRFNNDEIIFAENPNADGVYSTLGVFYHAEEAQKAFQSSGLQEQTGIMSTIPPHALFAHLIGLLPYAGYFSMVCLTLKKSSLIKHRLLLEPSLRLHQDTEFIYRLAYHCNLYGQASEHITALRGVHKNNRIIANRINVHQHQQSVQLLEKTINQWAEKTPIEPAYRTQIAYNQFHRRISQATKRKNKWIYFLAILRWPSLWRNTYYYQSLHPLLWGKSRFSNALYKIIKWRSTYHKPQIPKRLNLKW